MQFPLQRLRSNETLLHFSDQIRRLAHGCWDAKPLEPRGWMDSGGLLGVRSRAFDLRGHGLVNGADAAAHVTGGNIEAHGGASVGCEMVATAGEQLVVLEGGGADMLLPRRFENVGGFWPADTKVTTSFNLSPARNTGEFTGLRSELSSCSFCVQDDRFGVMQQPVQHGADPSPSPKRVAIPAPMAGLDIGEVEVNAIWRNSERIVQQLADLLRELPVHHAGQPANAPHIHKGRVARTAGHLDGGLARGHHDVLLNMPLLKLETTVVLSEDKRQALLASLSKIVAETIGKPQHFQSGIASLKSIGKSGASWRISD